jgi:hypothetical protein
MKFKCGIACRGKAVGCMEEIERQVRLQGTYGWKARVI